MMVRIGEIETSLGKMWSLTGDSPWEVALDITKVLGARE